jgi:integrase
MWESAEIDCNTAQIATYPLTVRRTSKHEVSSHGLPSRRDVGAMKLTQATMQRLALPTGKTEAIYFDDDLSGFGLRLRAGGSKNWIVQYSLGAKQRRMTLGSTSVLDAGKARETARTLLAGVRLGRDPAAERAVSQARASDEELGAIVDRFLARQATRIRPRSYTETRRYLKEHWKPLHRLQLAHIMRRTVANRLDAIADENGPIAADRARAALSAFFSWAIQQGVCEANPVVGTAKAADMKSRERVLSDAELTAIWQALPNSDFGQIVRLLILTGQRREEIGGLRWSEVDTAKRVITLPSERTKNHRAHDVPMSKIAFEILKAQPRCDRDYVFGDGPRSNGRDDAKQGGFQGWSKAKAALDAQAKVDGWRLHDLRRTVATRMAELGVQPHIVEAVLNHVSGHKSGIAGVYNRARYAEEKTAALALWARHLQALVADDRHREGSRIVKFPARAEK